MKIDSAEDTDTTIVDAHHEDSPNESEAAWLVITASSDQETATINVGDFAISSDVHDELSEHLGDDYKIVGVHSNFGAIDFIDDNKVNDNVFDVLELTVDQIAVLKAWAYINGTHVEFETSKLISGMDDNYIGTFEDEKELGEWYVGYHVDTSQYDELVKSNIDFQGIGNDLMWRGTYNRIPTKNDPNSNYYFTKTY